MSVVFYLYIPLVPGSFGSAISSTVSSGGFFVSSTVSRLEAYLMLAIVGYTGQGASFLYFFVFLLSAYSPFGLHSFGSDRTFTLGNVERIKLGAKVPSAVVYPIFDGSWCTSFEEVTSGLRVSSSVKDNIEATSSSGVVGSKFLRGVSVVCKCSLLFKSIGQWGYTFPMLLFGYSCPTSLACSRGYLPGSTIVSSAVGAVSASFMTQGNGSSFSVVGSRTIPPVVAC